MMQQLRLQGCYQRQGRNGKRSCQQGQEQVLAMGVGGEHWHYLNVHLLISERGSAAVLECYLMPHDEGERNIRHTYSHTFAFSINIINSCENEDEPEKKCQEEKGIEDHSIGKSS